MGDESESDDKGKDERLRAVIADDDPFARRVIKDVLTESGVLVIAEARNGRQAVELALYYRPDVVVMDAVMPELDGILATRQLLKIVPDQLVIVLTGVHDEDDELDRAQADRVFSDIADAIERGQRILDPRSADARLLQRLLDGLRDR